MGIADTGAEEPNVKPLEDEGVSVVGGLAVTGAVKLKGAGEPPEPKPEKPLNLGAAGASCQK